MTVHAAKPACRRHTRLWRRWALHPQRHSRRLLGREEYRQGLAQREDDQAAAKQVQMEGRINFGKCGMGRKAEIVS